jgi:uncharacterized protein
MLDPSEFTDRYVSLWNEPDPATRRKLIAELWAPDGANFTATSEYHGYRELEVRTTDAYEKFVGSGVYRFRSRQNAVGHHGVVRFNWEMINAEDGTVTSVGLEVFSLDDDGRILSDHQFIER